MPNHPSPAWRGVLGALGLAFCALFLVDAALFRTSFYYSHIAEPYSFASNFDRTARNGRPRAIDGRKQILIVGDSRSLSLRPRIAESMVGREFAFGNAAVPATDARSWYYLLRGVDPGARRYFAILIGVSDCDDADTNEEPGDRLLAC